MNAVSKQLFFEDVTAGTEIPPLHKGEISISTVIKFAGATGDFAPVHHDIEFARSIGLPNAILHGQMKVAYLCQLITDWAGEGGNLKKLDVRIRRPDYPGDVLAVRGKVIKKYTQDKGNYIKCEVWIEKAGERTTTGTALVALPSRR